MSNKIESEGMLQELIEQMGSDQVFNNHFKSAEIAENSLKHRATLEEDNLINNMQDALIPDEIKLLSRYLDSSDSERLSYSDRQWLVNIIFNPTLKLFCDTSGDKLSLSDWLSQYYEPLGVDISIGSCPVNY